MHQNAIVISAALIWLIVKVAFLKSDYAVEGFSTSVMLNMLLMLTAIFSGLYLHFLSQNRSEDSFVGDFKVALQIAGKYLLLFLGAMTLYYSYIDHELLQSKAQAAVTLAAEQIADEEVWTQLKNSDPQLADKTKEDYLKNVEENSNRLNSTRYFLAFSTMGSLSLAIIYSITCVVLFRLLLFRQAANNSPHDHTLN